MTYASLNKKIRVLAIKINAPEEYYPDFGKSKDFACPHIEINFPYYYWIITERGQELEKKKFIHTDELMYEIFKYITSNMAIWYEVDHRITGEDTRRLMFAYQLELMGKLSSEWQCKLQQEIDKILNVNPYVDNRI